MVKWEILQGIQISFFAKFYLFKKGLNFLFNSLVLMEKDLIARFPKFPGGFPEKSISFSLSSFPSSFGQKAVPCPASSPAHATSSAASAWIRSPRRRPHPSLPLLSPRPSPSLCISPHGRNPSFRAVGDCRHCGQPRTPPSYPGAPPCLPRLPRPRTMSGKAPLRRIGPSLPLRPPASRKRAGATEHPPASPTTSPRSR